MKKILLAVLLSIPFLAFAQGEFAPLGATWYYEAWGFTTDGYEKISSEKDTTVNGIACRKLTRTQVLYDFLFQQYSTFTLPSIFVYDSNNVYYFFSNNHWSILYDFSKTPGEFWTSDAYDFYGICGPIGNVFVDSSGIEDINGTDLKWISVHDTSSIFPGYFGTGVRIYQRLGCMYYLFPIPACVVWEGGFAFRCYSDSTLNYSLTICDTLYNSVSELKNSSSIKIFPNPAKQILFVQTSSFMKSEFRIYDLLGKNEVTLSQTPINGTFDIDISNLKNGIHFLKSGNQIQMFIKE